MTGALKIMHLRMTSLVFLVLPIFE